MSFGDFGGGRIYYVGRNAGTYTDIDMIRAPPPLLSPVKHNVKPIC